MWLKMAALIVIVAPYENGHQICAAALSLNNSRRPRRLLVTHLHLFENGATGALRPIGTSSMPLQLPWTAVLAALQCTCCSEID